MQKNINEFKYGKNLFYIFLFFSILFFTNIKDIYPQKTNIKSSNDTLKIKPLSLNECIRIALENNHKIRAAREDILIATAQKKQAESGYWPQVSANAAYSLTNQDPLFILPSFKMSIPPISAFGSTINMGDIQVPQEDIKLMDKQNIHASIDITYPLYTGGKIQALNKEAQSGIEIADQEYKKSNMEIDYDIKRFYYAVVLAKRIYKIGIDALDRLNITLELTESLYKNGSGKTTKLDYLKNKVLVDEVKTLVSGLKTNIRSAKQALMFSMGTDKDFNLPDEEIPFDTSNWSKADLLIKAFKSNPDWNKLIAAVSVYKAKIEEAKSGFLPSLAIIGSFNQNFNSYKYGITNKINSSIWMIGLGAQIPIFNGFRTKNEINEAGAQLRKIDEQKHLLHDAIILQTEESLNKIESSTKKVRDTFEAKQSAAESCSLTERAFQQDMADAKDLIQAQILESFMDVQYQKALYDHAMAEANLELIIGSKIMKTRSWE